MTKTKSTKRALLMSALSLLLCVSMLIGTTYAWFTDTAVSAGNKIVAGNLDVDLVMWNGTEYKSIANQDAAIFGANSLIAKNDAADTLWEPGKTQIVYLGVANKGNLDLKYNILLNVIDGGLIGSLEYAIVDGATNTTQLPTNWADLKAAAQTGDVAAGTTVAAPNGAIKASEDVEYFALAVHMKEEAGNQYQGKNVTIDVTVTATQLASEADSFGNQYDAGADYDGEISNAVSLAAALKNGGTYKVISDIALTEAVTVSAGAEVDLDLSGNTLTGSVALAAGSALTVYNGIINNNNSSVSGIQNNGGTLVLDDVNISSARHGVRVEGGDVTINGGTYEIDATDSMTQHALNVSDGATVTINDGTFIGPKGTAADSGAAVNVQANSTVIINGGNFSGGKNNTLAAKGNLTVYGGTFDQNPSAYLADGYTALKNDDGSYTVMKGVAATDNAGLDTAIQNGADTIVLGSGNYIIPDSAQGKTLTIVGNGNTVVATQDDGSYEGCDYSLDGSTVTFENITINTDSSTYTGYARLNATYKNCTINGTYTLYGDSVFEDCTFNVSGDVYNIWTWGAPNATFNGCTFNSAGKALLLYGTVNTNLTVNNCVFNDNGGLTDLKAAIEIGNDYGKSYTLTVNNTVVNGYEINDKGINTGSTLWANKNSMGTDKLNVVIDGVDVY